MKYLKKFLIYICILITSAQNVNAAMVSDNDGSSFITYAEFDSLKNDFQLQIDSFNSSIDTKISNAINSYLTGIKQEKTGIFANTYSSWKCGTNFKWGNNTGYKTSDVLGGGSTIMYIHDVGSHRYSTLKYSNTVTNNIFLATGANNIIYLKPRQHVCVLNEVAMISFGENSVETAGNLTYNNRFGGTLNPTRAGDVKTKEETQLNPWPGAKKWDEFIAETITENSSLCGIFSPNRTLNEYFVKEDGDMTATPTINATVSTKGTYTGNYNVKNNQTMTNTIKLGWQKTCKHNELIISEWSKDTEKEEKIKSGAPVAHVTEHDCEVTITYTTDKAGTLYIYSSVSPKAYNTLASNNYTTIVNISSAATNKNAVLRKCSKGDIIRAIFIPTSGTGVLSISDIKYKLNS